jgi:hypothetical protein
MWHPNFHVKWWLRTGTPSRKSDASLSATCSNITPQDQHGTSNLPPNHPKSKYAHTANSQLAGNRWTQMEIAMFFIALSVTSCHRIHWQSLAPSGSYTKVSPGRCRGPNPRINQRVFWTSTSDTFCDIVVITLW